MEFFRPDGKEGATQSLREEVDALYIQIQTAQQTLEKLRQKCTHPQTRIGNYSWRIGTIASYHLCVDCDFPVRQEEEPDTGAGS